jgi:uncharacterized protein (TIGR00251 family)
MTRPWQHTAQGVRLRVHLQPRASHNRVVGSYGESLKIALTAPPVEGAANAALLRFLASQLNISVSALSLLRGEKSRDKQVLIRTTNLEQLDQRLAALLRPVDKKKGDD